MKHVLRYFGALLLAVSSSGTLLAQDAQQLRAGAAAVDITPKLFPLNMPGGFSANMAEKAHDALHARALVFDDGKMKLAIVLVDNLGVARETADEAKFLASRRCDLLPERILISSTHTHSAPASNVVEGPKEAVAYRKLLVEGIAEALVLAHGNLRPAAVGAATHPLPDEVFNRRWFLKPGKMPLNPFGEKDLVKMNAGTSPDVLLTAAGPTDPDVSVLSVQDAKTKKPLAIYANYALHYVGGTPSAMVSADYFGEFARLMPNRMGIEADGSEGFVAMLSNGASGDINNIPFGLNPPRPPREPFEQIRIVAGKTADAAWQAKNKITAHQTDVRLGMLQREITLKLRKPTTEQTARAKEIVAMKDPAEKAKLPPLAEAYANRALALAAAGENLKVPLQAIVIGDCAICAIPFETFVEIGLDLKRRSPFPRTIVVGISNGYNGYLPTPEQHKLGGYETWLAKSSDLLNWTTLGRLLSFADTDTTHWDSNQRAGYVALQNTRWGGNYKLQKYDGRYWMPYLGSNTRGYEEGKLSLGMAFTTKPPHKVTEWQRLPKPTLTPDDPDVRWWENKKHYKSTVIWDKKKTTGYPFVLYYNANGDSSNNNPKYRLIERIGMAVSNDMKTWKRFGQEPIIDHQSGISGDAVLQKMGDLWIMFYFGAFWNGRKDAYNRFACSYDLVNWTKWQGADLIAPSEPYENLYAHKSYVIKHKGIVYHFYCAVNKHDQRGIAVATSKDLGKSTLPFVAPPPKKKS